MASNFKNAWSEVMRFFSEEPDLLDNVVSYAESIEKLDATLMKEWSEAATYEGFNVKEFVLRLSKKYNDFMAEGKKARAITVKYDQAGKEKTFSFSTHEVMMKDLTFLILIFVQRGSAWEKIRSKTNTGVMEILDHLKEKYNINTEKRKATSSLARDTITLPRIAACFPLITLQLLEANIARVIVDADVLTSVKVPKWMKHPAAACLVVHSVALRVPGFKIYVYGICVLTDNLLHRSDSNYSTLQTIMTYMEASINSPAVPDLARLNFLATMGVAKYDRVENNWSFTLPSWDEAGMIETILSWRPDDKTAKIVRKWLEEDLPA